MFNHGYGWNLRSGLSVFVAFAIITCPPTTEIVSFSKTAVDNVPLITAFSNSALPSALICQPVAFAVKPDINGFVSIVPPDPNTNPGSSAEAVPPLDKSLSDCIFHPAIFPSFAVMVPCIVTSPNSFKWKLLDDIITVLPYPCM